MNNNFQKPNKIEHEQNINGEEYIILTIVNNVDTLTKLNLELYFLVRNGEQINFESWHGEKR